MEITVNETKYLFKNDLFIFERNEFLKYQKLMDRAETMSNNKDISNEDMKKYQYTEMDFMFDIFPIFCLSINWEKKTKEEMTDHIKKVDMKWFEKLSTELAQIMDGLVNTEKKKS